jgi:hypothetical protein
MSEIVDHDEPKRQPFDPGDQATWPRGMSAFIGLNVWSDADAIEAYRAWREEHERELRIAVLKAQLSTPTASPPTSPVSATASSVATSPADDVLLTLNQAVAERGVGKAKIKSAIRSGELPGEYPERDGGRGYRVWRGNLMAWRPTSGRTKPTPPAARKREPAADQPPELRALGLRFTKGGA